MLNKKNIFAAIFVHFQSCFMSKKDIKNVCSFSLKIFVHLCFLRNIFAAIFVHFNVVLYE